ncbi:hypothetical protein [Paracidovorax wautersii]
MIPAALGAALLLSGCAAAPRVETLQVRVPVPVACLEPVPERPSMPTEGLQPGASVDDFTRTAQAEIERREGYEGQLRAALDNCRKPIEGRDAP